MRLLICLCLLGFLPLSAAKEKDLNLAALKKAHHWLVNIAEDSSTSSVESLVECSDLTNTEHVWDSYKEWMQKSIVIIRKYPKKITEKLTLLFTQDNRDILPLIVFYMYSVERNSKTFHYYDPFHVIIAPANQENLWVALIPFIDENSAHPTNYSVLIMDLNHHRIFSKD